MPDLYKINFFECRIRRIIIQYLKGLILYNILKVDEEKRTSNKIALHYIVLEGVESLCCLWSDQIALVPFFWSAEAESQIEKATSVKIQILRRFS